MEIIRVIDYYFNISAQWINSWLNSLNEQSDKYNDKL